ncbi:hypothetical protein GBK02_03510 [Dechloromonas sp. TW-R-39-2]|uniref:hypothetical protein n=1 Tax=Dechloromonas sp. TW-R-39-2 TaxID=2654218 RepID=UPI00193E835E|nr:hypothetical protein [Dechloromonas sp. TW-R-39-2]QRM18527.1 hypothetical protein GBK02_03510 [Dechloromonas sp. TW-R-39-2]
MRVFLLILATLAAPVLADEPVLRPSARLVFKHPAMLQAGQCVVYEEGGSGWVMTDPVYYLKGKVVAAEVRTRHLGKCPVVPGKNIEQYSREEFNRQALAYPCVSADVPERDEQIGIVRLRVSQWETPHARKAANAGRLYRGMFIDQALKKDMDIELEADLLGVCEQ